MSKIEVKHTPAVQTVERWSAGSLEVSRWPVNQPKTFWFQSTYFDESDLRSLHAILEKILSPAPVATPTESPKPAVDEAGESQKADLAYPNSTACCPASFRIGWLAAKRDGGQR